MKEHHFQIRLMRQAPFNAADHSAVGAWFRLICYCTDLENGGIILGCKGWSAQSWMSASLSASDVQMVVAQGLASWNGSDLHLVGYNRDAEQSYLKKTETERVRKQKYRESLRSSAPAASSDLDGPDEIRPNQRGEEGIREEETRVDEIRGSGRNVPRDIRHPHTEESAFSWEQRTAETITKLQAFGLKVPTNQRDVVQALIQKWGSDFVVAGAESHCPNPACEYPEGLANVLITNQAWIAHKQESLNKLKKDASDLHLEYHGLSPTAANALWTENRHLLAQDSPEVKRLQCLLVERINEAKEPAKETA